MTSQIAKPQLVKQWADWALFRHAQERYELVRGDRSLSQKFAAADDKAAISESSLIVRRLEKPAL